jgi:hypothetical protein
MKRRVKHWELDDSLPLVARAGQVWQLADGFGGSPELVLVLGKTVPDWGPGYASAVHSCVNLSSARRTTSRRASCSSRARGCCDSPRAS